MAWNGDGYRAAAWAGIAVLAASVAALAWLGSWHGAAVALGSLATAVVFVCYEPRLPALFDFLFAWAVVINPSGYAWDLYPLVPHYDAFVHFCTTFAVTLTFGYLAYHSVAHAFRDHPRPVRPYKRRTAETRKNHLIAG